MKMLLLCAAMAAIATEAGAATLTCSFTEPFFSLSFDSATGRLTYLSADDTDPATGDPVPKITEGVRLVRDEQWQDVQSMRLLKGDDVLLQVKVTGDGSDGMSDSVYPFEGISGSNVGGCQTDKVKAYNLLEVWNDLGVK